MMTARIHASAAAISRRATGLALAALLACSAALAAPFAYVPLSTSGNVTVIDIASNTVVGTIPVGLGAFGVAVNSAGTRAYVARQSTNTVTVIDGTTQAILTTIAVGAAPTGLALNPFGTRLYVANLSADTVSVVDTTTNTVIATIPGFAGPYGIAVNPAGTRVYVTNSSSANFQGAFQESVSVINTVTNTVIANVRLPGNNPNGIAVNSAGTRVYAAYYRQDSPEPIGGSVAEIDAQSNTVIRNIVSGPLANAVAINPAGSRVYVSSGGFATVNVIDVRCGDKMATVPLFPAPGAGGASGLAVSPDGSRVYVASDGMKIIDTATNTVIGNVPVGSGPIVFGAFIMPSIAPPPAPEPPVPAQVTGIELTQAIQDVANNVPLLLNRRTFARVYVQADGPAVPDVIASLSAIGAFTSAGSVTTVPLAPIMPSNAGGPRITVPANPMRSNLGDSFLFDLPWQWTSYEGLRLHATLGATGRAAPASCRSEIEATPVREFRTFTTLKVQYVRLGYNQPGLALPAGFVQATTTEQQQSESFMRRLYPVSELTSGPDFPLFDPLLGSVVDQTALFCPALAPNQNLCAYLYVSGQLASLNVLSGFADGPDVIYGLIPEHPLGKDVRGACCQANAGAGPSNDDDYASHEVGHFLDRHHPDQRSGNGTNGCGHSKDDPNYPHAATSIGPAMTNPESGLAGFDGGDAGLVGRPAAVIPAAMGFDIMGYCEPITWISDYTYKGISLALQDLHPDIGVGMAGAPARGTPTGKAGPLPGDWLLVTGLLSSDLANVPLLNVRRADRIFAELPRPPGDFSIRLLDQVGVTLADYPFAPVATSESDLDGEPPPLLGFTHTVPFVAGTRQVRILHTAMGGAVLASRMISANAPVIGNVVLQDPPQPITGIVTLAWTASDADEDALRFDVFYTDDAGATLWPLAVGVAGASTTIDTSGLGGGSAKFRVVANDGLLTAYADTASFALPAKPPAVRILVPGNKATVYQGQVVNFEGDAKDPQDGEVAAAGLAWSAPQGPLGTGPRISVANLPLGIVPMTLTATNSVGLMASKTVQVTVLAVPGARGPTLTAGPGRIGWWVGTGETQLQTAPLEVGNSGSGVLQFSAASGAPWLSLSAQSGTAPATLTLTANPGGFAEGSTVDTTVTLTATGDASQVIVIPVRLGVGNTFAVGNATVYLPGDAVHEDGFE